MDQRHKRAGALAPTRPRDVDLAGTTGQLSPSAASQSARTAASSWAASYARMCTASGYSSSAAPPHTSGRVQRLLGLRRVGGGEGDRPGRTVRRLPPLRAPPPVPPAAAVRGHRRQRRGQDGCVPDAGAAVGGGGGPGDGHPLGARPRRARGRLPVVQEHVAPGGDERRAGRASGRPVRHRGTRRPRGRPGGPAIRRAAARRASDCAA